MKIEFDPTEIEIKEAIFIIDCLIRRFDCQVSRGISIHGDYEYNSVTGAHLYGESTIIFDIKEGNPD
jgi:hypothetical protein